MQQQYCTGIGTRYPPARAVGAIEAAAHLLYERGLILRSGGAEGCDTEFAKHFPPSHQEIYLPFNGFEKLYSSMGPHIITPDQIAPDVTARAAATVDVYHPFPHKLKPRGRLMMQRNAHQVLGRHMTDPSLVVVCWASGSLYDDSSFPPRIWSVDGGTGQAVRIAYDHSVPVFNLSNRTALTALAEFLDALPPHPQHDQRSPDGTDAN